MNRIFRIIWSQAMNAWVVVSELATSRGKRSGGTDVPAAPTGEIELLGVQSLAATDFLF